MPLRIVVLGATRAVRRGLPTGPLLGPPLVARQAERRIAPPGLGVGRAFHVADAVRSDGRLAAGIVVRRSQSGTEVCELTHEGAHLFCSPGLQVGFRYIWLSRNHVATISGVTRRIAPSMNEAGTAASVRVACRRWSKSVAVTPLRGRGAMPP